MKHMLVTRSAAVVTQRSLKYFLAKKRYYLANKSEGKESKFVQMLRAASLNFSHTSPPSSTFTAAHMSNCLVLLLQSIEQFKQEKNDLDRMIDSEKREMLLN